MIQITIIKSYFGKSLFAILAISILLFNCGEQDKSAVEIHYIDWNLRTFADITCDKLWLIANTKVAYINHMSDVKQFMDLINNPVLIEIPSLESIDSRVCCYLVSKSGDRFFLVSFGPASVMEINGDIYKTDEKLFNFVLKYLPKDYLE